MKKFEDYTREEIKRIDRTLAKKMEAGGTISESEKAAFLEKAEARSERREANREQWREAGKELATRTADKAVDRLLDKTIRINDGNRSIEMDLKEIIGHKSVSNM
jgi:hypothetical protein